MPSDDQSGAGKPEGSRDIALIHGVTPEGDLQVLRKREDRLELGAVRALREGVPITGEVVKLTPRKEFPLLCDVETALTVQAPERSPSTDTAAPRKGPAQVATESYRTNWDRIWNRAPAKGDLSN